VLSAVRCYLQRPLRKRRRAALAGPYHSPPLRPCASRDRELRMPLAIRPRDNASVDEHRGIQRKTPLSGQVNCDRTVISQAWNLEEHRGLRTHTE
jgi:hypothetical protein